MAYLQPTLVNGSIPAAALGTTYGGGYMIEGFQITYSSTSLLSVSPGMVRAYNQDYVIESNKTLSLDISTIGPGGCYPISASTAAPSPNNMAMNLYVVDDPSGTQGAQTYGGPQLVLATGNDFVPTGFSTWAKIGTVVIATGTNTAIPTLMLSRGSERHYQFVLPLTLVSSGSATTLTEIELSEGVNGILNPYFSKNITLQAQYTPNAAPNALEIVPSTPSAATPPVKIKASSAAQIIQNVDIIPDFSLGDLSVYYKVATSDSVNILLVGFKEDLGLQAV